MEYFWRIIPDLPRIWHPKDRVFQYPACACGAHEVGFEKDCPQTEARSHRLRPENDRRHPVSLSEETPRAQPALPYRGYRRETSVQGLKI
jgi:hypothetical protein